MEIFEKNKMTMRTIWAIPEERQNIEILLFETLANSTNLSAKDVNNFFIQLDSLLSTKLVETEEKDRAL